MLRNSNGNNEEKHYYHNIPFINNDYGLSGQVWAEINTDIVKYGLDYRAVNFTTDR